MPKRTFLSGLLGAIGLTKAAEAQQPMSVDPSTIRFSMPTIANDGPPLAPFDGEPAETDLVMHEADWRQLEFFQRDKISVLQAKLQELKAFEAQHRSQYGWRQIYVRELPADAVLFGANAATALAEQLDVRLVGAPFIFHGTGSSTGRVRNGFTLQLGAGAFLYGFMEGGDVPVLGAHLRNADDLLLANAFAELNRSHGLVLVDWRAQMLLMSVDANGQLVAWSP